MKRSAAVARRIAAIVAPPRECPLCCDERHQARNPRASHGYCDRHAPHPVKVGGVWHVVYGGAAC